MPSLEILGLSATQLTGTIPPELGQMENLEQLWAGEQRPIGRDTARAGANLGQLR